MEGVELLIDLHKGARRQGPGDDEMTATALALAGVDRTAPLQVADIGCGTGASTLVLAGLLNARITAVDFLQDFLDILQKRAEEKGLAERIIPLCCSMDNLPFADGELDLIWSEGAIYSIGFRRGTANWRRYLKAGGLLVVSEITWTTGCRPVELTQHWQDEYPEIDLASAKMAVLESNGYSPIGYFTLPEECWLDAYYRPLQAGFDAFLARHNHSAEARAIVEAEQLEIELYEKYKGFYSYGVYLARKTEPVPV